ncbi:MAG: RNA polymerase sigma factor [bacterium]
MDRNNDLFWELVEPEHLKLRAYCRKLLGNREDGDDLYQDALVSALAGFDDLRQLEAIRPWLYRIVINTYKNRMRRPWWRRLTSLGAEMETTLAGENPVKVQAARRRLETAFRVLSPDDRTLVTLFELQGWRLAELADLTGRSEGSLKTRLSRARGKMRNALGQYLKSSAPSQLVKSISSEDEICVVTKPGKD